MSCASPAETFPSLRWLAARWSQLLFSGAPASELGVHRLLFYAAVTVFSVTLYGDVDRWAGVSDVFWSPTFFFGLLDVPVQSAGVLRALLWIWRLSLVLACVGLFTRLSTGTALLLGFYLVGLPHNFGKINHGDAIVVLGLAVFACSRAGDGWSLDRLRRIRGRENPGPAPSGDYSWPLGLYRCLIVLVLFAAGVAKLRAPGPIAWVLSDNLYYTLIRHHYTHTPPVDLGLLLTRYPWTCQVVAGSALLLELLAPVLLVLPARPRALFAGSLLGMMLGFWLMLGVLFAEFMTVLAIFFFPWRATAARIIAPSAAPRLAVLYDGSCGLCQRTIAVIQALDLRGRVELLDLLADWPRVSARWPALDQAACLEDMHVIVSSGHIYTGFYGYRALAWELPLGWLFVPLLYIPGVPAAGVRVYSFVARRRHATGCPLPM